MKLELSKADTDRMNYLITTAKPRLRSIIIIITTISFAMFLVFAWTTYQYWSGRAGHVSHLTSLLIGGQLVTLYGAGLTAVGSSYNEERAALMSMTRIDGNPHLFYELMRTKIYTRWGFSILTLGFLVQAISMLLNETITL